MKKSLNDSQKRNPSYKPEFVAKILESRKQFENGRHKIIAIQNLWINNDADLIFQMSDLPNDDLRS